MKKYVILLLITAFVQISCSKDEGYGGRATISGKVFARDFDSNGNLDSEGYAGDIKVYISAHGNTSYFDNVDTAYDGSYKFEYLHEGTYDIWVFGDCDYCPWNQVYELKTIEVTSRKADVVVDDFVISI